MTNISVFDFNLSNVETFLHDLAPAQSKTVLGGSFDARVLTIHDGINRVEDQIFGFNSEHDNNYSSVDNSDKVSIWA
ncbi:hypothetical protein [Nostoc sp. MG11]|uniref:hypothetical protein n=1 Tax=Nostoc sp. MG11 TaxID=2721166 RepID=UPI0018661AF5|nr:hypothetical protein [Nostoc sp. MG11]